MYRGIRVGSHYDNLQTFLVFGKGIQVGSICSHPSNQLLPFFAFAVSMLQNVSMARMLAEEEDAEKGKR